MKKYLTPLIPMTFLLFGCGDQKDKETEKQQTETQTVKTDSLLITEKSWGSINAQTDYEGLKNIFGESALVDSTIMGPEGIDTLQVTFVYPGTNREMTIHWKDTFYHKSIGFVESYHPESPYRTETGLKIGSTFRELLAVNQQRISFLGFGWDYGGNIMSYNKGKLEGTRINFRLESNEKIPDALMGDKEFHTDDPLVKSNLENIRIYSIMLSFHEH